MDSLVERVTESPELQRKLTSTMFQLGWIGESDCIRQNEIKVAEDGTILSEHPAEDCPLNIAIRDVPAEFQPVTNNPSVKVRVRPEVHEGYLAGDVVDVDCFAQNTESERVKGRQEAKDPDRERRSELRKNLSKHL